MINKSNHPVNIKRINLRIWTLRDEIEACIQQRIEKQGGDNVEIEDIKEFYSNLKPRKAWSDNQQGHELEEQNRQPGVEATAEINAEDDDPEEASEQETPDEGDKPQTQAGEMAQEVMECDQGNPKTGALQEFKRVKPSPDKMTPGFAFLSEIHMDQILFFGKRSFTNGQNIVIEFLIPNKFNVSAEVMASVDIDRSSRIISATKPSHRVQSAFTFLFDGERGQLRDFLKSIEPNIPPPPKKLKKQESEDDEDDDFDDLGF